MDEQERAKKVAQVIYDALERGTQQEAPESSLRGLLPRRATKPPRFTVAREGGCLACDPGSCWICNYLFSGERIVIRHEVKGERVISDRTLHLLTHGITRYQTKYVVYGEPVVVDLDLDELASYLDM